MKKMFFVIMFIGVINLGSEEFSFKINKDLSTDVPEPQLKVNVSTMDESMDDDFDPSLPATEPPESVKFAVKVAMDSISKSRGFDVEDDTSKMDISQIKYLDLVIKNAKEQKFDVELVLAIIKKESNFNPKARSKVGARGLMQLLPDTAKWLGLKDTSKLYNPDINIKYGIKYLRWLFNYFQNSVPSELLKEDINKQEVLKVVAAYNAGPGNVKKYDKPPHNGIPPFKETINYVEKVSLYFVKFEELSIPKNR